MGRREDVFDPPSRDVAPVQRFETRGWEGVGVEGDQGVFGLLETERVGEGEETGEVLGIGD